MYVDEVTPMEEHLRQSLRHVSPPPGFTDRVIHRVTSRTRSRQQTILRFSRSAWLAAAAALVLSVTCGEMLHVRHQQQAEAAAEAELDRALQLTSHAMDEVQTGVERSPAGRYAMLWNGR